MTDSKRAASPSSNPRYFYTDPLAAAWMAKHFGMKFIPPMNLSRPIRWDTAEMFVNRNLEWGAAFDYVIHPESLHLLKPKVGDYAHIASSSSGLGDVFKVCGNPPDMQVARAQSDMHMRDERSLVNLMRHEKHHGIEIVRRNGKSFFWPEGEVE